MGLFTPKYLSKDSTKAILAIQRLTDQNALAVAALKIDSRLKKPIYSVDELEEAERIHPNEDVLFSVALRDSSEIVRINALEKIQSSELVRRLAIESSDKELAKQACVKYLVTEHYFGHRSESGNLDQGKVVALYKATPHQAVRWEIIDNFRQFPDLIREIALFDDDFTNFKRIVESTNCAEEARAITEARGQSLPVCLLCHRPMFRYYQFGNERVCCWTCLNFNFSDAYAHTHKDVIAGIDIPTGRYLVMAVGTCEEGEEVRQVRDGQIFKRAVLTSQYNDDGIPGRMEVDFDEGDKFEGAKCGFQQKEIHAELIEINEWVK
jgi:hypothetical protein